MVNFAELKRKESHSTWCARNGQAAQGSFSVKDYWVLFWIFRPVQRRSNVQLCFEPFLELYQVTQCNTPVVEDAMLAILTLM